MTKVKEFVGTWGGGVGATETPEGVEYFSVEEAKDLGWKVTANVKRTNKKVLDGKNKPILLPGSTKEKPIYKTEKGAKYVKVFTDPKSNMFFIAFLSLKLRDTVEEGDMLNADEITLVTIEAGTTLGDRTFDEDTIIIGTKGGDIFL